MHTEARLQGEARTKLGSLEARRLRKHGLVPGNMYGHGQDSVAFSVAEEQILPIVRSGHKVLDIDIGGKVDKAMLREVQWDTFGVAIKHFDLLRVDADERLTVEVPLEVRGIAPGTIGGGVLEYGLRSIAVQCMAAQIPDHVIVKVGDLQLNQSIHVKDLEIADGMVFMNDPEAVVVRVVQLHDTDIVPAEGTEGPTQPELIGRQATDEEQADEK
jgi:large subunit ribosomal protein L25